MHQRVHHTMFNAAATGAVAARALAGAKAGRAGAIPGEAPLAPAPAPTRPRSVREAFSMLDAVAVGLIDWSAANDAAAVEGDALEMKFDVVDDLVDAGTSVMSDVGQAMRVRYAHAVAALAGPAGEAMPALRADMDSVLAFFSGDELLVA